MLRRGPSAATMFFITPLLVLGPTLFPVSGPGEAAQPEEAAPAQQVFDLLDNGDFAETYGGPDPERRALIPWWRQSGTVHCLHEGGRSWGVTAGDGSLYQPLPAYAKTAGEIRITGRLRGSGRLVVTDGRGGHRTRMVHTTRVAGNPQDGGAGGGHRALRSGTRPSARGARRVRPPPHRRV